MKSIATSPKSTDQNIVARSLYPHQSEIISFAIGRQYSAIFADMGTGKSLIAIELLEKWAAQQSLPMRTVYVCKNSLTGTVEAEFAKWASPLTVMRFVSGMSASQKLKLIHADWDVLVVNIESLRTYAEHISRLAPNVLIVDEAQIIKNRRAQQTRACRRLADAVKRQGGRILIMTGTPITKSILDLWSECDILFPSTTSAGHVLGLGNYQSYEHAVSIVRPHPKIRGVKLYRYIPEAVARVTGTMAKFSRVIRLRDCVDLPDHVYRTVKIELEPGQRRIYDALQRDLIANIDGAELDSHSATVLSSEGISGFGSLLDSNTVATPLLTTLLIRLQQVTSGFVKTLDGVERELPSAKLRWLNDNLHNMTDADGDHKCVIFCRFIHDVDVIERLCKTMHIGAVRLDGKTVKDAASSIERFQTDKRIRVLVGNVAVAGVGTTLTHADYCVFYSHSFNAGDRWQALKRTDRIGQTRSVVYSDLVAEKTFDEHIMRNITAKESVAISTLSQLRAAIA